MPSCSLLFHPPESERESLRRDEGVKTLLCRRCSGFAVSTFAPSCFGVRLSFESRTEHEDSVVVALTVSVRLFFAVTSQTLVLVRMCVKSRFCR